MNLPGLAPIWALLALAALLVAAAIEDMVRLRISNLVSIAVLLLAVVTIVVVGARPSLWENAAVFAATLVVGTVLFGRKMLGGGDVKLLAATSLWFDLSGALRFVVSVALAGGLLAVFLITIRKAGWSDGARQRVVALRHRGGIPYGVAIAAGALFALLLAWQARQSANPLSNWQIARPN